MANRSNTLDTDFTLAQIVDEIGSGSTSSASITRFYLDRIEEVDPLIRSVLAVNPDAMQIAAAVDASNAEGVLKGAPVLVKDNIDTGDSMLTTAGSPALAKAPSPSDAFIVHQLRKAGTVVLGKTNLSEWANMRSTHSSSGWSTLGGQTRNPHVLDRTPSGSSSGSAAAVAASLCAAAIGTETDGSIVSPASMCGIVGLKPSMGMVSRTGIVPISHSQDTAGPMTRTVRDAALIMSAISAEDPEDTATHGIPRPNDWLSPLTSDALQGVRVAFYYDQVADHRDMYPVRDAVEQWLREAGAVVVRATVPAMTAEHWVAEKHVMLWELVHDMKAYLARRGDTVDVHTLADIVGFNKEHAPETMPWFGQEYFELALEVVKRPESEYIAALAECRRSAKDLVLDRVYAESNAKVIVGITNGPAPVIDQVNGEGGRAISLSSFPAVAGYPHLTVPAGMLYDLPIGASFIGKKFADAELLGYGHAFECVSKARVTPIFMPGVS